MKEIKLVKQIPNCQEWFRGLGSAEGGSLSVTPTSMYVPDLQHGIGKMPRGDTLNGKQRRARIALEVKNITFSLAKIFLDF